MQEEASKNKESGLIQPPNGMVCVEIKPLRSVEPDEIIDSALDTNAKPYFRQFERRGRR